MAATGQAGGGEGQAQGGEGQNGNGQGEGAPDFGALSTQVGQIASGQEEMRQFLASNPWAAQEAQQQGQEGEGDQIDLSFLDQGLGIEDPAALSQRLNEVINGAVDTRAQALMAPLMEKQEAQRRDQEARDLAAEFPELASPEVAQKIAGRGGLAEQAAAALGKPELAAEPAFWRLVYGFSKAAESANQQGSDPGAAHLESGSGASPGAMTEADLVKQIAQSGPRGAAVLDGI